MFIESSTVPILTLGFAFFVDCWLLIIFGDFAAECTLYSTYTYSNLILSFLPKNFELHT